MKKKNENMMLYTILAIAVVALFYFGFSGSNNGADNSDVATQQPLGISAHFADADYNEIELSPLQSAIQLPGMDEPIGPIYFMRFDVSVTNEGTVAKDVKIIDAYLTDANGNEVTPSIIANAFYCVMNSVVKLEGGASYLFDTDPTGPGNCGSISWIPTTSYESIANPLKLNMVLQITYDIFGIVRTSEKVVQLDMAVLPDDESYSTISAEIIGGTNEFIKECQIPPDVPAAETQLCPGSEMIGSVCEGAMQTCLGGLWPGCPDWTYGNDYSVAREVNGNIGGDNFKITCTDGLDNDCDGYTDKPLEDGTCPEGVDCDYDCPECIIKFRTNADLYGSKGDISAYNSDTWIAIPDRDSEGNEYLVSAGYYAKRDGYGPCSEKSDITNEESLGYTPHMSRPDWDGYIITRETYNSDIDFINIWYEDENGDCDHIEYSTSDTTRCKVGDEMYPHCISPFRITVPYSLYWQETCLDY